MPPAKRPWFRFYVEAVGDRKLRRLKPEVRWLFVACLAAARQSPVPGRLLITDEHFMNADDLADFAGLTRKQVDVGVLALIDVGVLDVDDDGWFVPAWSTRQYESDDVTRRTRRYRSRQGTTMERSKNGEGTPEGTPPETEADTETEPPPPTSAEPPAELDRGGGDLDQRFDEAARLLAEAEADRRGAEIGSRAGYIRARTTAIRRDLEPAWRAIAEVAPDVTAEHLAKGEGDTAGDRAVHAMRTRIDLTERRKRGEVCPDCDDRGVVELDDSTFDDCACKTRRSA
jgi:hypothetical protein